MGTADAVAEVYRALLCELDLDGVTVVRNCDE
jgi:hypothetical protein